MAQTVYLFDEFYPWSAETLIRDIAEKSKTSKDIKLIINSKGGEVISLFAMIDAIKLMNINLETYCIGQAASCGAWLFSMGQKGKRYISKNSTILLHQVSGGARGDIQDMEIQMEKTKQLNEKLLDLIAKNTGKDKETLRKDLERDLILTAEQAVAYGIADKVIDENTPEVELFKKEIFEESVKASIIELAKSTDIKFFDIPDKEIFRTCNHKGKEYSEKDVEDLVNNTNYLITNFDFKIPLKVGHDNSKELIKMLSAEFKDLIKSDSMPAFGYAENIRKVNNTVVADFKHIPEPIYNLMQNDLFSKRSPEIFPYYKANNGKMLGLVLDSIALLGATQPAIPNLFSKGYDNNIGDPEMSEELRKQLDEKNAALAAETAKNAALNAELTAFKAKELEAKKAEEDKAAAEAKATAAETELANYKKEQRDKEINAQAEDLVVKGAIFPYQKEAFKAILNGISDTDSKIKFSKEEGKEEEMSVKDAVSDLLANRPKIDFTKEYSLGDDVTDLTDAESKLVNAGIVTKEEMASVKKYRKDNE